MNRQRAHDNYLADLQSAWRQPCTGSPDDPKDCVIPDGYGIKVSMAMMDSCQCDIAKAAPVVLDSEREAANRRLMDSSKAEADKVAAYRDHHDAQRARQDAEADTPYGRYVAQLNDAWRNPA